MASRLILVLASLIAVTHSAVLKNGAVIPTYAKVCSRSQLDINDCLKDSIQTLIQKISKDGIRQLNFLPLDPWKVAEASYNYGISGSPLKISLTATDINTYGFSKIQILGVRSKFDDPENIALEVDFFNKKIFIDGNYHAEGLISEVPVIGKGKVNVSMTDIRGIAQIKGHLVERDNDKYLQIDNVIMRPDVGDMKIQMSNDNIKNPELNNLFVALMNQFWRVIYQELLPLSEANFDKIMTRVFNMATLKVPFNQLIPQ